MTDQAPQNYVYSEKVETFSTWKNNNTYKASFRLLTDKKMDGIKGNPRTAKEALTCNVSVFRPIEVQPGQSIQLPSEYDQAIRTISPRTGEVVGGLCPWLVKVGEESVVVNKSLDYQADIINQEALKMVSDMKREAELKEALAEIEKRRAAIQTHEAEKVLKKKG